MRGDRKRHRLESLFRKGLFALSDLRRSWQLRNGSLVATRLRPMRRPRLDHHNRISRSTCMGPVRDVQGAWQTSLRRLTKISGSVVFRRSAVSDGEHYFRGNEWPYCMPLVRRAGARNENRRERNSRRASGSARTAMRSIGYRPPINLVCGGRRFDGRPKGVGPTRWQRSTERTLSNSWPGRTESGKRERLKPGRFSRPAPRFRWPPMTSLPARSSST